MSAWGHMYRKYDIVYNNIVYVDVMFHLFFKIGRENAYAENAKNAKNAKNANNVDAENAMG
jgi:hypothetical protein